MALLQGVTGLELDVLTPCCGVETPIIALQLLGFSVRAFAFDTCKHLATQVVSDSMVWGTRFRNYMKGLLFNIESI